MTILSEILAWIWAILVLALGGYQISGLVSPTSYTRTRLTPGRAFVLVTNCGFPVVTYVPFYGMLIAWTKDTNFQLTWRSSVHNRWVSGYLFIVVLYTGLSTFTMAYPLTSLASGKAGDRTSKTCLMIVLFGLGVFLKYSLVGAQRGMSWIGAHDPTTCAPGDDSQELGSR